MPFASGIFTRLYSFVADAAAGIPAQPQRFDNELNGIATALTDCVTRDGQSAPYTNLPMGGHNFANLGPATVAGQAMTYDQLNAIAGAAILGASDNAAGIKWTTIQAFINYLLSTAGAGAIGTTDGSNVQADLTNFVANAVAAIAPYSTSAQNSAAIATSAVLGLPYFGPGLLNASTAAGGSNILPQGIMTGTIAGTAITGATVGTYPLTPASGSFTGVTANLVVTSATAATIVVTSPGRTTSASPTATVWTNPAGATIPAGTTLTGNIASQIANGNGQTYLTTDSTGNYLLYWQNTGTGAPSPVIGATGAQVSFPLSGAVAFLQSVVASNAGGSGSGLQFLDKRGLILAALNGSGFSVAGSINAGQINAPIVNAPTVNINNVTFGIGPDGHRICDKRGFILMQLTPAGVLSAPSVVGGSGGGSTTTPVKKVRRRIASTHGGWSPIGRPNGATLYSNGTSQLTGTDVFQWTANTDVQGIELVFVNGIIGAASELSPVGNAVQMVVAVEQGYNLHYPQIGGSSGQPISSGGRTGSYIGDGEIVLTKPSFGGMIAKGANARYRVHKKVTAGQYWPLNSGSTTYGWGGVLTTDAVYGSTKTDGSDQTVTYNANVAAAFGTAPVFGFQATAVIAEQITPAPVCLITGDSVSYGYGGTLGEGFIGTALTASNVAWHNDGLPGIDYFNLAQYSTLPAYLADFVDHAMLHCGSNEIFTAAVTTISELQAKLLLACKELVRPDTLTLNIWTVGQRNTSSDDWATYANQTRITTSSVAGFNPEAFRIQWNNFLRDKTGTGAAAFLKANLPSTLTINILDYTPLIERNSDGSLITLDNNGQQAAGTGGYWPVNGSAFYACNDGIHTNAVLWATMGSTLPSAAALALPA
ncbi:hypothetical protein [Novosphingobium sp.]|uniref:hypothetical protein n=1 Tax=Novosphingobium sp. TaxID=1874826 RepID=UPI003D0E2446